MTQNVHATIKNGQGVIALDREKALNSLSLDMIRALTATLLEWRDMPDVQTVSIGSTSTKAFCAGGDIRFFYEAGQASPRNGSALVEDFFTEEYALNHLIHHYPKPYVALMDGIVMGGGMGIAQAGKDFGIRIVTERTKMAMPEAHIGLFPDVGGSFFLSRCPGNIGMYLGLTGMTIHAADAIYAGLADLFVPSGALPALQLMMSTQSGESIQPAITNFAMEFRKEIDISTSALAPNRTQIDRHFAFDNLPAIISSLQSDDSAFAHKTLAAIGKSSPLMAHVTLEQLRRGAMMNFSECLRMERTMVRRCFEHGEVVEGVRALVIDKDNKPVWNPATLDAVTPEMVNAFFKPAWPEHAHPLKSLS